ncbi:MAG: hypothetical protein H6707_08845 [Deltaproteobacteria bacterium]|nr:hypothetical protein [Deltaproteobacteria bacterium]
MKTRLSMCAALLAMLAFAACGSDSKKQTTDGGTKSDGTSVVIPDGTTLTDTTTLADTSVPADSTTNADATVATRNCMQLLSCLGSCTQGDNACLNACEASGKPASVQLVVALAQCVSTASGAGGKCETACKTPSDPACSQCWMAECSTQLTACQGDS